MWLRTERRVRHVRQDACPGTYADLVLDVRVRPAGDRAVRRIVVDHGVAAPAALPSELLVAFVEGFGLAMYYGGAGGEAALKAAFNQEHVGTYVLAKSNAGHGRPNCSGFGISFPPEAAGNLSARGGPH